MDIVSVSRNLTVELVERGYRAGTFPMGGQGWITWHRPPVRAILPIDGFHVSRSLERTLKQARFEVTVNRDFEGVMRACADREETWIDYRILHIYKELHRMGKAHSVEVWVEGQLAGGVYGVSLGGAFFAESKFHRVRDMSKVALAHLVFRLHERGYALLDVQYWTPHLASLGVIEIPGDEYLGRLGRALELDRRFV